MYIYNYTTATADSFYLQQFLCRQSSFFFFFIFFLLPGFGNFSFRFTFFMPNGALETIS